MNPLALSLIGLAALICLVLLATYSYHQKQLHLLAVKMADAEKDRATLYKQSLEKLLIILDGSYGGIARRIVVNRDITEQLFKECPSFFQTEVGRLMALEQHEKFLLEVMNAMPSDPLRFHIIEFADEGVYDKIRTETMSVTTTCTKDTEDAL